METQLLCRGESSDAAPSRAGIRERLHGQALKKERSALELRSSAHELWLGAAG